MSGTTVHVVGAGLAGLAAALAASRVGARVRLYEAAPQAGGRCRSMHDPRLDRVIDNGSHLLLGINRTALAYARRLGAELTALPPAIAFAEPASGRRWGVTPGNLPAGWGETLRALGLPWLTAAATVGDRLAGCPGYRDFWQPLCLAMLNTPAERASARLFARVLRAVLPGGRAGMRGYVVPRGLSATQVDPALELLHRHGGDIRLGHRLTAIRQSELTFGRHVEKLGPADRVILALPPWDLARMLPGIYRFPSETIVNVHYRLPLPVRLPGPLGLIGTAAHWLFVRGDVVSATLSATAEADPAAIWAVIAPLLAQPAPVPPHRVIRERRATIAHDPATIARRPGPTTPWAGVFLAGDWLDSPWPCTIESAVSSGLRAARLALGRDDLRFS